MADMLTAERPVEGAPLRLTARAAKRINLLKEQENTEARVRLAVHGGGCSGFNYAFSFDDRLNPDDLLVERDGAELVVDGASLELLKGSEVDYIDDLSASAFRVINPNATASCGCGTSFAV
jgi:iron-sulfur cluster insertion protein